MDEHEHAEFADLAPEWLHARIVDPLAVEFGTDGHALKAKLMAAARKLLERRSTTEWMCMRGADEAAGIIALRLLGLVVDKPRRFQIGAHSGRAGEPSRIDARQIHHAHVLVEVVEQRV